MSSTPRSIPRTNIANTTIIFSNGVDGEIAVTTGAAIFSIFDSNPNGFSDEAEINRPVPYDCIIRNARIFIITSAGVTLAKLNINGTIQPDGVGLELDLTGTGLKTSLETFTQLKKGDLLAWEIKTSTGGDISKASYMSIEMIPT